MASIFEAILKGLAMGLLLVLSVGPVIFTIIKHSISNGRSGGFSFVIGVWISDFVLIILSNAFSQLVTALLDYKMEIGVSGSIFLLALGLYYLFFKKIHFHPEDLALPPLKKRDHAKIAIQGFLLNTLNPAVMIFWLTASTAIAITHTIRDRIIIFSTALLLNIASDILKVVLAGKLRKKLTLKNIRMVNKISGLILLAFGTVLLVSLLFFGKNIGHNL